MGYKRDLGNSLQRNNMALPWFCPSDPAAARASLSQAQHVLPRTQRAAGEETTVHIRSSTTAARGPCFLHPHASKLTIDGLIWVSPGVWLLRLQDMQPSSVLLPDLFLGHGEILPSSSSELQALTEKKPLLCGVGAATDKEDHCQVILMSFCEKLSVLGRFFFSGAEQGKAVDRNAIQQTALEQIQPCAVQG